MNNQNGLIQDKTFNFALSIIELYKVLCNGNEYVISKQLLRSGTSIGANVEEATAGQTKKDFITKMAIASKEARETRYWLKLLKQSYLLENNLDTYLDSFEEIIKILTGIVKTAQSNLKNK